MRYKRIVASYAYSGCVSYSNGLGAFASVTASTAYGIGLGIECSGKCEESSMEEETKLPEAVALGTRGGNANMRKYGKRKFCDMASRGWKTTMKRYGRDGYRLIRYGFKIKSLLPVGSPAWERALAEIRERPERSPKRTKVEMEAERTLIDAENHLLILHGFKPGFMTVKERASALSDIRAGVASTRS